MILFLHRSQVTYFVLKIRVNRFSVISAFQQKHQKGSISMRTFRGLPNLYRECPADTLSYNAPILGLNSSVWVIIDEPYEGL